MGSTKRLKIWYCGSLVDSVGVSSFSVSRLKSLMSLKLTDLNPMSSIRLIAAANSDFFSCSSDQFFVYVEADVDVSGSNVFSACGFLEVLVHDVVGCPAS
jgi:hypothetical protein